MCFSDKLVLFDLTASSRKELNDPKIWKNVIKQIDHFMNLLKLLNDGEFVRLVAFNIEKHHKKDHDFAKTYPKIASRYYKKRLKSVENDQ